MEWIPPCKGETHAVKFQAQVLGQKNPTHLFRPYRACHCFTAHTQGDALGFHIAPRWGWEGVIRDAASPRWGWEGRVHRPRWTRGPPHRRHLFQVHPQGNDLSPNGAPCESPGHRPRSYTQVIGRGFAKLRTSHGGD